MVSATPIVSSALPVLEQKPLTPNRFNGLPDLRQFNIIGADDAVIVDLKSGTGASTATLKNEEDGGVLFNALRAMKGIAKDLKDMQSRLSTAAPGSDQAAAIQQEIEGLNQAYQQLTQSELFQRGLNTLIGLQNGGSAAGAAFAQSKSLLGAGVAGAAASGRLNEVNLLAGALKDLASIDPSSPSAADMILSVVDNALSNLRPSSGAVNAATAAKPDGELRFISLPQMQQMTFGQAEGLTIGLRTLAPGEMIKAAAAHMDLDLERSIMLIAPQRREKERDTKEPATPIEEYRQEQAVKLGLFYGSNEPEAILRQPGQNERIVFTEGTGTITS